MQAELRSEKLLFNVEILGVNSQHANSSFANQLITASNPLSWLQETEQEPVWNRWGVTYRDVRILDPSNRLAGVFNLTSHDLSKPTEFAALKAMFIAVATNGDSDANKLPDQWQSSYPAASNPDQDTDGDTYSNYLEFVFGTDPLAATSHPVLQTSYNNGQLALSFTRWAGTPFDLRVDASTNLATWSALRITLATTNLYDGTGRSIVTYKLPKALTPPPSSFMRVRVQEHP
jgi:hypothetical protein